MLSYGTADLCFAEDACRLDCGFVFGRYKFNENGHIDFFLDFLEKFGDDYGVMDAVSRNKNASQDTLRILASKNNRGARIRLNIAENNCPSDVLVALLGDENSVVFSSAIANANLEPVILGIFEDEWLSHRNAVPSWHSVIGER